MQTQTFSFIKPRQETSLNLLTKNMLREFLPSAVKRKSFFVNNIPHSLLLNGDKTIFAYLLSSLLSVIVHYTSQSCITINTKEYHDIILLHVNDRSLLHNPLIEEQFNKLQPIAEKLGGSITLNTIPGKMATVTLSFFNPAKTPDQFS
jgi:hypothetical protein